MAALEATRLQEELERITKAHTKGECVPQHLYDDALAEVAKLRNENDGLQADLDERLTEVERLRAVLRMTDLADLADQLTEED
jgi:hypothetical protein